MAAKIWKSNLKVKDRQTIYLPEGAKIIAVGAQDSTGKTVQLWMEADPKAQIDTVGRRIAIAGTGHDAPPGEHLGTVITAGGALVWHVYELPSLPTG